MERIVKCALPVSLNQYLAPSLFSLSHSFLLASSPPFPPIILFIPLYQTLSPYLPGQRETAVMESAIQTVVGVFLKSAKGKESLGGNDFQKLVKSQLHNIMMVS